MRLNGHISEPLCSSFDGLTTEYMLCEYFSLQMLRKPSSHPHRTCSKAKNLKAPSIAAQPSTAPPSSEAPPPKCTRPSSANVQSPPRDNLAASLGLDSGQPVSIQEAFGSLLNAQEILGATGDGLQDELEGEMAFERAYEKLHCPTPSTTGSLGVTSLPPEAYTHSSDPFSLGAAVDSCLKLRIIKGLFVPFEVLLTSTKGITVNQYLRNPFHSPDNDPKLRSAFPALSIKR